MGAVKLAFLVGGRRRERAFAVPEQFALDPGLEFVLFMPTHPQRRTSTKALDHAGHAYKTATR